MSDDVKYSEAVGAIVTFFREAQEALNIARDAVEETENLTQDKLHMLELCDELKYHEIVAMREELAAVKAEKPAVRNPEVAPVADNPATGNRPLTLDEVLALPEGARVWVEYKDTRFRGHVSEIHRALGGTYICDPSDGIYGLDAEYLLTDYKPRCRVWSLPQAPTPEELERWPWKEGAHNA